MRDLIYLEDKLKPFLAKNASVRKAIIINSFDMIEKIAGTMRQIFSCPDPLVTMICFKAAIPEAFCRFKESVKLSEDYLAPEDYAAIDEHVFAHISREWDKNIFSHRGVDLAKIAEYGLQSFLVPRVKALAVIAGMMRREKYGAIFVIDTNEELNGIDSVIRNAYGIGAGIFSLRRNMSDVKGVVTSCISKVFDALSSLAIRRKRNIRLIDARLYYQLLTKSKGDFIPVPFEEGLRLRLKCLKEDRGYLSFSLGDRCPQNIESPLPDMQPIADKFVYNGINYWEMVEDKIKGVIGDEFRRFKGNIDRLIYMIGHYGIRSITLRNDLKELEKTLVLTAKLYNVPTVVVQHGILAETNCSGRIYADKIAVWGEREARWYRDFGNDETKTAITGNPYLDGVFHCKAKKREDIESQLGLSKRKFLVTLIGPGAASIKLSSFTTDDAAMNMVRGIIDAIRSLGDTNLVIKRHPHDHSDIFNRLMRPEDNDMISIVGDINLSDLITASDLVIIKESSVVLKALALDKPVVVVNLTKRPDLVPCVERGVAIGAYRSPDIEGAIRRALNDEGARRAMQSARLNFLKYFAYKNDGMSRERVLNLIENI